MKRIVLSTIALVLTCTLLGATAYAHSENSVPSKQSYRYRAVMKGTKEVPPVATDMSGRTFLHFNKALTNLRYQLFVFEGEEVTMAHLHCAVAGQNGPVVATLMGTMPGGIDVHGRLMMATLRDRNIEATGLNCSTPIDSIADLKTAMNNGQIYVNVHTVDNPNGEIRGQVVRR